MSPGPTLRCSSRYVLGSRSSVTILSRAMTRARSSGAVRIIPSRAGYAQRLSLRSSDRRVITGPSGAASAAVAAAA